MKNVCDSCKFLKIRGFNISCVKYGIPLYTPRLYCVSYEGKKNEQVREQEGMTRSGRCKV